MDKPCMRIFGPVGILVLLMLTACSGVGSKQEMDLVENGYIALSGGDYDTAEYLLNQALRINDKNPSALLNLGVIYQETKRFDKAREYYQAVIDLNSKQTAAASNVKGYTGKNLADIARANIQSLPPLSVNSSGAGADADNDGVPDAKDKCNRTPEMAVVNGNGCWTLMGLFQSGMTTIGPGALKRLDQVKTILNQNPSLRIEIQGHTDNLGSASANKRLSEKRAQSVMQYLIEKGVDAQRLQWAGYGQMLPLASNETANGRKLNRRVELRPIP
jgi:outer membrane protein OmpA-like peptidoglycan-associated protein